MSQCQAIMQSPSQSPVQKVIEASECTEQQAKPPHHLQVSDNKIGIVQIKIKSCCCHQFCCKGSKYRNYHASDAEEFSA